MKNMKNMKVKILRATRNAGEYVGSHVTGLLTAQGMIMDERKGRRVVWRQEGDDICGYASNEDMSDEDKAIVRLRPASE
jgi:hypothetical protein